MEKTVKEKWVKALRSGKYVQGRNGLRKKTLDNDVDQFCCLGVLCDVIDSSKWQEREDYSYIDYNGSSAYLPIEISKEQKILAETEYKLTVMNDSETSFAKIADYIEENL